MVIDLLLDAVGLLIDALLFGLPSGEPPFVDDLPGWAVTLRGWLFFWTPVLPIAEQVELVRWVVVIFLPGWWLFLGVRWIVSHIPFLGGG